MIYVKPRKLQPGDTIGIVSPSWGGPASFPYVYREGIRVLTEELGFKVKEFNYTKADASFIYENPKLRAEDINDAFLDAEVKGIISSIGGDDSIRILPHINKEAIVANPKFFMGYSDTTTLLTYFNQLGLVTFNGPSVMAGFSQWSSFDDDFREHIRLFLTGDTSNYIYREFNRWTDGYLDWSNQENVGKVKPFRPCDGWRFLQGGSIVTGELFGGCIEVLEFMKGTEFWASKDFWNGKILFFETSEEKPSVENVKRMLRNYGSQGVFEKISGVLFGRARGYSDEEKVELDKGIVTIIRNEFGKPELPIISNMDFGHTDPQIILPLGIKTQIDCRNKTLKLAEPALR